MATFRIVFLLLNNSYILTTFLRHRIQEYKLLKWSNFWPTLYDYIFS